MFQSKPKPIIFFIILSIWSILSGISLFQRYSTAMDYNLLANYGWEYLFFVLLVLSLLFDLAFLWFLFKPRPAGFWVGIGNMVFGIIHNIIIYPLMLFNLDATKHFYVQSREMRGLPVRKEESLNFMFSPMGAYLMGAMWLAVGILLVVMLVKNKKYFQ